MPMLDIQRRHAEVFRIRLGDKSANGAPRKLTDSIRVTSPSQAVVQAFCDVYGGTVQPWTGGEGVQHEAYLPTTELSIMVLPGQSLSQWWERWTGSVCQNRCDGYTEQLSGQPCKCPADLAIRMATKDACRPMTRVNVICPDVDVVGAGGLVTHGMIAAETLPQSIAVAEAALARGLMVPAVLRVVEHKGKKHFIVPQIEIVGVSLQALATGEVARGAIESGSPVAIGAPAPAAIGTGSAPAAKKAAPVKAAAKKAAPGRAVVGELPPLPGEDEAPARPAPAASAPTPAPANGNGPVCGACGLSLAGCAVKIEGGVRMHKDGCPTGSGPDGPGAAHESEPVHEPNATTGLEREPIDVEAEQVPAASTQSDDTVYRDVDILKLCGEVFRPARDAAPRGEKTRTDERLRYALTWAVTAGRATSLKQLTAQEKHRLWMELSWLRDGINTWEVTGDALVITHSADDREVVIPFNDVEETTAA